MSDFTPAKHEDNRPVLTGELPSTRWFMWSLMAHGLVALALWFTPVRQIVMPLDTKSPPAPKLRADQVEAVVEQTRSRTMPRLQEALQELQEAESEMRETARETLEQYRHEATTWAETAPQRASEETQDLAATQEKALRLAEAAQDGTETLLDTPPPDPVSVAAELVRQMQASRQKQIEARDTQREIKRMLDIVEGQLELKDAHAEAAEAQIEASRAVDSAIWHLKQLDQAAAKQKKAAERVPTRQKWVEKARLEAERHKAELAVTDERIRQLEQQAKEEEAKGEQGRRKSLLLAKRLKEQTKKRQEQEDLVKKRQGKLDQERRCLEKEQAERAKTDAELKELKTRIRERQQRMVETQRKALEKQAQASKKTAEAVADKAELVARSIPDNVSRAVAETPPPAPELASIAELYKSAVAAEQRTAELYRQERALKSAMQSKAPLQETLAQTQSIAPARKGIDEKLLSEKIEAPARAIEHRKALERVEREVEDIVATVKRMEALARHRGEDDNATVQMDIATGDVSPDESSESTDTDTAEPVGDEGELTAQERLDLERKLAELATEDATERHKDLSALMRTLSGEDGAEGYMPAGPPAKISTVGALGARRLGISRNGMAHPGWVFIDSWHLIGPFANPGRRHIETRFPPESVIDLDAVYRDRNGRALRWVYQHAPTENVRPLADTPYAIFYGYSEIWCEEGMRRTIAIGSDDYSKVWVNGLLVWASGKQYKNWRADEAYRTVYFKKGINRILIRLENGHGACSMSVMIEMTDRTIEGS